jgi:hypothetical protein
MDTLILQIKHVATPSQCYQGWDYYLQRFREKDEYNTWLHISTT